VLPNGHRNGQPKVPDTSALPSARSSRGRTQAGPTPCSVVSGELGEPLAGTAPKAAGWLLVEHSGPWGPGGFDDSGLPDALVTEVAGVAQAAGVRIQFVRRPGARETGPGPTAFLARSHPASPWLQRFRLRAVEGLLELPIHAIASAHRPASGTPVEAPIFLTCTHGRRDACCARFGREASAVVASEAGSAAWETTHTGGHRFAANLIVLPHGLVYGRVTPERVAEVISAHGGGRIALPLLRGRCTYDPWVQAADVLIRQALGADRIDALRIDDVRRSGDLVHVDAWLADGAVHARLRQGHLGTLRAPSCGGVEFEDPVVFELEELTRPT